MSKKKIVLCEKGEAARDLMGTQFFGMFNKGDIPENDKFIFLWCAGHLYAEEELENLNPSYVLKFRVQTDFDYKMPNLINEMHLVEDVKKKSKDDTIAALKERLLNNIKKTLKRKDYDEIILAADADAEGERIHYNPIEFNKHLIPKDCKITRFWNTGSYKSLESVKNAYNNRQDIKTPKYVNLLGSAYARSKSDYIFGMKMTKLMSDKTQGFFRCGRVVSAILGIIGRREDEIRNFVPRDYWNINGVLNKSGVKFDKNKEDENVDGVIKFKHFYYDTEIDENGKEVKSQSTRYFIKEEMEDVINRVNKANLTGVVVSNNKRNASSRKPKLYSTDEFNSEFMDKYGVDYETSNAHLEYLRNAEYTSYPRTDGNYFKKDDKADLEKSMMLAEKFFGKKIADFMKSDSSFKLGKLSTSDKNLFDDAKAEKQNHTPLILTNAISEKDYQEYAKRNVYFNRKGTNIKLEYLIEAYEMIGLRCLIHLMPDDVIQKESILINIDDCLFEANAETVIYDGWKAFAGVQKKKNSELNLGFKQGDKIKLDEVFTIEGKTTKPPHYNQKTLLNACMFVNQTLTEEFNSITDPQIKKAKMARFKEVKQLLYSANGIGTQATRETIFKKIEDDGLLQMKGKDILLSDKGWYVYNNLPNYLKSIETTAIWEQNLTNIRNGLMSEKDFVEMVDKELCQIIDEVLNDSNMKINTFSSNGKVGKPSEKMVALAKLLADKAGKKISKEMLNDFNKTKEFIDQHKDIVSAPSSKKVEYAKAIANSVNVKLTEEQLKDNQFLNQFIEQNKDKLVNKPSENMVKLIKFIESSLNVKANDDVLMSFEKAKQFIDAHQEQLKSKQQNKIYSLSDKQINILMDERNNKIVPQKIKDIIKNKKNQFNYNEYDAIKKIIEKIFNNIKK